MGLGAAIQDSTLALAAARMITTRELQGGAQFFEAKP